MRILALALFLNLLAVLAQIPELLLTPASHGIMHYPVLGRVAALVIGLAAPIVIVPMALRPGELERNGERDPVEHERFTRRTAGALSLMVLPIVFAATRLAAWIMDVRFFWR